jgi:uncharacterized protein (DUF2384 family)
VTDDQHFLRKSAGKASSVLGVTDWYDDVKFLEIFKHLYSLCGADYELMRHWIHTPNAHLKSKVAANLITTEQGIQDVLDQVLYYSH